jgi:phosphoglycerate-specific signal transduction histidine kinase
MTPEYITKWRRKNKKRYQQSTIKWREKNKEKYNEYQREYRKKNHDKVLEIERKSKLKAINKYLSRLRYELRNPGRALKYYYVNREKILKQQKEYKLKNSQGSELKRSPGEGVSWHV